MLEQEAVAVENKSFTEHLAENSFYFHTINDPDLTIYGQKVPKTDKKAKEKKEKPVVEDQNFEGSFPSFIYILNFHISILSNSF